LKEIEFFKKLAASVPMDLLLILVRKLTYQKLEEREVLFKYGQKGNSFFIIIDGEVSVTVP
jgi:CRP-like cAMP-binding protein